MKPIALALAGLALGACAHSLAPARANHVVLTTTYDPTQVRDAVAHVVMKRHFAVEEQGGVIRAIDRDLGCAHAIEYSGRGFDIRTAPLDASGEQVDSRCLDASEKLGKLIVKEVERPAKLADKEAKRQRRAARLAAVGSVFSASLAVAGEIGEAAAPIAEAAEPDATAAAPAPNAPAYQYGAGNNTYSARSDTSVNVVRHQVKPFFTCPGGTPFVCNSQRAADDCASYRHCAGCGIDQSQRQFCP